MPLKEEHIQYERIHVNEEYPHYKNALYGSMT